MKIVFSYASYRFTDASDGVGGEEIIAWETVSRLANRGVRCHVFSPRIELSHHYENITAYPIPGCDYRPDPNPWRRRIKAARFARLSRAKILKLMPTVEPDLIHHIVPSYPGFSSSVADVRVPFIWGPATVKYSKAFEGGRDSSFVRRLYDRFRLKRWKETLRQAAFVLLEVEDARRALPEDVQSKVRTIHSGVDAEQFTAEYRPNKTQPTVLYLTAIRKNKGAHILMQAIPKVLQTHPNARFRFVGKVFDPPFFDALVTELGIGQNVEFTGSVPHDQIPSVYGSSDLYCLPTLQDNAPLSLLEAMSCSRPVVASRLPGIEEVFEDGVNGALVPPGDADALAVAIENLLSDESERRTIARRNRELIERHYSWDAHIDQILDVYREATAD